jgi:hypothetical protein
MNDRPDIKKITRMEQKKILPNHLIYFFLLASVFILSVFPITDNDVWWHLKTGEFIVKHGLIPRTDIFSFTIYGKPWVTFEWLSQVVLYLVFSVSGLTGLTLFKASLAASIFALLIKRSHGAKQLLVFGLCALGFLAMRDGFRERPQLFTYFFCALYPLLAERKTRFSLFALPALQLVWVNMHGAASLLGFGLICIYFFFEKELDVKTRLLVIGLMATAMFINPNGYKVFSYAYQFFTEGFNKLILEYQPPRFSSNYFPFFITILAALLSLKARKNLRDPIIVTIFAGSSFLAVRNIPVFVAVCLPIIINNYDTMLNKSESLKIEKFPRALLWGFLLSAALFLVSLKTDVPGKYRFGFGDGHKARFASNFLRQLTIKGNIFNDYDLGGYLIWSQWPQSRVFIDGRLVEYGKGLVSDSFYFWKPEVWERLEKKYDLTAAVFSQENYYSLNYIDGRADWSLVYWDDGALIYLKNVPENGMSIKLFGYKFLCPESPSQAYLKTLPRESVLNELRRSVYFAPQSERARAILNYIENSR